MSREPRSLWLKSTVCRNPKVFISEGMNESPMFWIEITCDRLRRATLSCRWIKSVRWCGTIWDGSGELTTRHCLLWSYYLMQGVAVQLALDKASNHIASWSGCVTSSWCRSQRDGRLGKSKGSCGWWSCKVCGGGQVTSPFPCRSCCHPSPSLSFGHLDFIPLAERDFFVSML